MARRRVLPKGAGRVNCTACGATAAADGNGSPIVLAHAADCPELKRIRELGDAIQALHNEVEESVTPEKLEAGLAQVEKAVRDRPCRAGCACSGGLGYHA